MFLKGQSHPQLNPTGHPVYNPHSSPGRGLEQKPLLKSGCKGVSQAEKRVNYSIKTKGRGVWVCEPLQILAL
jgi:hypothetical protein